MGPERVDTGEAIHAEGARACVATHIEQELTPVAATMAAEAQVQPAVANLAPPSPAQAPARRGDHRFLMPAKVMPVVIQRPGGQMRPAHANAW